MHGITAGALTLIIMAALSACDRSLPSYRLSGHISDRAGQAVALLHCTFHTTDTMAVTTLDEQGRFHFEGTLHQPSICVLRIGHDDLLFLMDNVPMTLHTDTFTSHRALHIEGLAKAEAFNRAVLLDKDRISRYNATEAAMQQRIASGDTTLTIALMEQRLDSLDRAFRAQLKASVAQCDDPITAVYLLHLLSTQQEFAYLDSVFPHVARQDTASVYVRQFGHRLQRARAILEDFAHRAD